MEGFTYVDIFATKGIEYLVIIGVLATFVAFWKFLKIPAEQVYQGVAHAVSAIGEWFSMPAGLFFHQGHGWARPEGGDILKVGMDDFAQKMLGKIDALKLPSVGDELAQGEKGWSVQVGSKMIDMLSPVGGRVVAVNEELLKSPAAIASDPYNGASWIIKVQSPRTASNLKNLLSGDLARKWMDGVRDALLARGNYSIGALSQDGGVPVDGIARNMDPENWDKLVKDFFLVS